MHEKFHRELTAINSLDKGLRKILAIRYSTYNASLYFKKLQIIQQNLFYFIDDYVKAINKVTTEVSVCRNWSVKETITRQDEAFMNGLSAETALEMSRLEIG